MHRQNEWINKFSDKNQRNLFLNSRSTLSKKIVGVGTNVEIKEIIILLIHLIIAGYLFFNLPL
jgi:hypothetical protein